MSCPPAGWLWKGVSGLTAASRLRPGDPGSAAGLSPRSLQQTDPVTRCDWRAATSGPLTPSCLPGATPVPPGAIGPENFGSKTYHPIGCNCNHPKKGALTSTFTTPPKPKLVSATPRLPPPPPPTEQPFPPPSSPLEPTPTTPTRCPTSHLDHPPTTPTTRPPACRRTDTFEPGLMSTQETPPPRPRRPPLGSLPAARATRNAPATGPQTESGPDLRKRRSPGDPAGGGP